MSAANFDAGDVITIVVTVLPGGQNVIVQDGGTLATLAGPLSTTGTLTYTVPAATTQSLSIDGSLSNAARLTWSCSPAPASKASGATDSQKLQSVQNSVAPMVGNISAQATGSAIDTATNNAFGDGGAPFSAGPGSMTVNFAAEPPPSTVAERADAAFAALGYAGGKSPAMPTKAPYKPMREWSLWADVRGTGWHDNVPTSGMRGHQINLTMGLGRKLTPDWLVGIVAGYERFDYDIASLTGSLKGDGFTVGAYTAWRILPTLRWDAALAWSRIDYDASAGAAQASFSGSRWLASTGLTGTYRWYAFIVEPSAKVFALWETQSDYTDSLGIAQPEYSFSSGRVATGGRAIYPWMSGTLNWSPYLGLYADWRFGSDSVSAAAPVAGISDGWSGRVTGGISIMMVGGTSLTLGGEYGGLGADFKLWTASARAAVPF